MTLVDSDACKGYKSIGVCKREIDGAWLKYYWVWHIRDYRMRWTEEGNSGAAMDYDGVRCGLKHTFGATGGR